MLENPAKRRDCRLGATTFREKAKCLTLFIRDCTAHAPSVCAARVHTNRRGAKTANSSSLARGTPQGISKDCVRFSRGSQKQFSRDMQQRGVRTRAIVEPAGKNGIATDRKVATNVSPVDALSSPIVPNAPPKDKTFVAKGAPLTRLLFLRKVVPKTFYRRERSKVPGAVVDALWLLSTTTASHLTTYHTTPGTLLSNLQSLSHHIH